MAYFAAALLIICFNLFKFDYFVDDFKLLYPFIGEWITPSKDGEIIEKWELKYEKMMKGKSFYVNDDEETSREDITLVLENREDLYIPKVTGKNDKEPIKFTLTEIDENKFIFENKEHDFPQRITYELKTKDEFIATIEGETKKGLKKIQYKFKRKKGNVDY